MPVKIKIEHLTKIFGKRIKTALTMVEKGEPKNEILKKTGATVGVYDTNFEINIKSVLNTMSPANLCQNKFFTSRFNP